MSYSSQQLGDTAKRLRQRLQRPKIVSILGWLLLLYSLVMLGLLGLSLGVLMGAAAPAVLEWFIPYAPHGRVEIVIRSGQLLVGVVILICAMGVLRMRSWAWLLAMIVLGINLALLLTDYVRGRPSYWEMLLSTLLVFLLNQQDVQRAFSMAQHTAEPDSIRTAEEDQAARDAQTR